MFLVMISCLLFIIVFSRPVSAAAISDKKVDITKIDTTRALKSIESTVALQTRPRLIIDIVSPELRNTIDTSSATFDSMVRSDGQYLCHIWINSTDSIMNVLLVLSSLDLYKPISGHDYMHLDARFRFIISDNSGELIRIYVSKSGSLEYSGKFYVVRNDKKWLYKLYHTLLCHGEFQPFNFSQ